MSQYFDPNVLNVINDKISLSIGELFDKLEINLQQTSKAFYGNCPIHNGDNHNAFSLYKEGYKIKNYWCCRTKNCQYTFKPTGIGFVRGRLSTLYRRWKLGSTDIFGFKDTIDWICDFLKLSLSDIKISVEEAENNNFVKTLGYIKQAKPDLIGVPRSKVKASLSIPSVYFVDRGYCGKVLTEYDVGDCTTEGKPFYGRAVVPIYDPAGVVMVGCTGRDISGGSSIKWLNSKGPLRSQFYGYALAKPTVKSTKKIIIVEGPPDVWKLREFGVKNAVALLGSDITDEQLIQLECCGAMSVYIMLDNDDAGKRACGLLAKKLERSFNVYTPKISVKDPGLLTQSIFNEELKGIIC